MCGITGALYAQKKNNKPIDVLRRATDLYEEQTSRGKQGFGAAVVEADGNVRVYRSCEPVGVMVDMRLHERLHGTATGCVFHHRYPTSTQNTLDQTHPILVSHDSLKRDYLIVHNGVIQNDKAVKELHDKAGFAYTTLLSDGSFNDSETCAIEFARAIEKPTRTIRTRGGQAMAALAIEKKTGKVHALHLIRHKNPLIVDVDNTSGYVEFASELRSGAELPEDVLHTFYADSMKLVTRKLQFVADIPYKYIPPKKDETERGETVAIADAIEAEERAIAGFDTTRTYSDSYDSDIPPSPVNDLVEDAYAEAEAALDNFALDLSDPDSAAIVRVEDATREIRTALERMKSTAMQSHEFDRSFAKVH